jgi:hypothetical protein
VEQTEIDALATLRPRDLEEIVTNAIGPYYDASLAARVAEAEREWQAAAQRALNDQIDGDARTHFRGLATAFCAALFLRRLGRLY